jgi:hypothetical protein
MVLLAFALTLGGRFDKMITRNFSPQKEMDGPPS